MPRILASRISFALPRMLPVAIFLMNAGISICVGQARVHGASKQYKQRLASIFELCGANGGLMSAKFFSYSASVNFGARFLIIDEYSPLSPPNAKPRSPRVVNELYALPRREQRKNCGVNRRRLLAVMISTHASVNIEFALR